jgi:pilus assembly protein Flp/PilA
VAGVKRWLPGLRLRIREEAGQSMVEYGMIVSLVAVAVLSLLSLLYNEVAAIFGGTADLLRHLMIHP